MKVKISKNTIKRVIKEEITRRLTEDKKQISKMLMDAGFNADGSAGSAGGGPASWQLYTPESMTDVPVWIQAAKDLNSALDAASSEMMQWVDKNPLEEDSYGKPSQAYSGKVANKLSDVYGIMIEPIMSKYSSIGAYDTEPRSVALEMLERRVRGMLGLDPDDYSIDLWNG
jgi:hypothetical protein